MVDENENASNNEKKSLLSYFDLGSAVDDLKKEFTSGDIPDKAKSSAKLVGKTLFNVGLYAGKLGWETAKSAPQIMENYNNEIREAKLNYENLPDAELLSIIHSKGVFGKSSTEKGVISSILKGRGFSIEEINSSK